MNWKYNYVIARPTGEKLSVQFCTDSLKNARLWLRLAGEAGDCLFLSPAHEKNANQNCLIYNCHMDSVGLIDFNLVGWLENTFMQKKYVQEKITGEFSSDYFTNTKSRKIETSVLVLDSAPDKSYTGPESLLGSHWKDLSSLLSSPIEAITGSLIQPGGSDNFILISVGASSDWPCSIRFEQDGALNSDNASRFQFSVNAKI